MRVNRNEYDNVKLGVEKIKPGGHRCIIKDVRDGKSSTGKDQLIISFDTSDEDLQPKYYTNDYLSQDGTDKKWHGTSYITEGTNYFLKNLKQFVRAVESSNEGFIGAIEDGDDIIVKNEEMAGKKVGIVFAEKEDLYKGKVITKVNTSYFCNYADALSKPIPNKKLLANTSAPAAFTPSVTPELANEGFMQVNDSLADIEGLPFN